MKRNNYYIQGSNKKNTLMILGDRQYVDSGLYTSMNFLMNKVSFLCGIHICTTCLCSLRKTLHIKFYALRNILPGVIYCWLHACVYVVLSELCYLCTPTFIATIANMDQL